MESERIKKTAVFWGIGVSPGIVSGKAYGLDRRDVKALHYKLTNEKGIEKEIERFGKAVRDSEQDLLEIKDRLEDSEGIGPLFIDVHVMMLKDDRFIKRAVHHIEEGRINAEWALGKVISERVFKNPLVSSLLVF